MRSIEDEPPKLSRFEVVGAWLHVWTPPRGARVPPVPWREVGLWALALLVVGGAALAVIAPKIDAGKDERAARAQEEQDARAEARRAKMAADQRAQRGTFATSAGRAAVVAEIEQAIGADARARFDPDARTASCSPSPGADPAARKVAYDCFSSVRAIEGAGAQAGARGELAIPFRAVVDFPAGAYAFCKLNPVPSEAALPDPDESVPLPAACRIPRD